MTRSKYKWYELHPNLYSSEINTLINGLNGVFRLLKLYQPEDHSRVMALGYIMDPNGKEYAVHIVFPVKYPRSIVRVISVNILEVNSEGDFKFAPSLFGKGNQYDDGSLCLIRKDLWDYNIHNIGWCLKRAQAWLVKANSPEGFQKEEIVEEITLYNKPQGQVLFPQKYVPDENLSVGRFVLTQFKPNYYIFQTNVLPLEIFPIRINEEIFVWKKLEGITAEKLFENNYAFLIKTITQYFGQISNFGFYLPNDHLHWHFFKMEILSNGQFFPKYLIGRVIDNELYLRTKDIFDNEVLKRKRVTIIGLGALGSEVARSLARNGVGHFNLFDFDTFEIGNSVRHAADLFYIGENKTEVAKQLILRSNPNITVNTFPIDIMDDDQYLEESLEKSDLCICLTADDKVDYILNDYYSLKYKIPFIFSRVSSGGRSGSIQIVESDTSACLRCLSKNGLDLLPIPRDKQEYKELPLELGCGEPALPGSEIDTKEISIQVSRVSLQLLLRNSSPNYPGILGYQYYWHGPSGSKTGEPFQWEIQTHKKDKKCEHCNK